ncbi:3-phosphoserine/phosphohydroxythreonine transaminase [Allorhodopirellula heiligendammensis]|uniref:Phosphoserine aminotransferase n=1 Tax=Allorhodopirellula heiligendammensis TaxID=2714739 RepID=A0A5C6C149_9BACT|nr:3-phosphoserine/phosphohydroxythreonine transaminase [Allorhodopirellula heiligendammensis]TWU16914.1 Phosphoserine aminotransferase [Allorhodopirellula heiligendammensis]
MTASAPSAATATDRVFNFSAGPAALPESVLREVQDEMLCLPGAGASLLEISHRDKLFVDILHDAQDTLRSLLGIGDDYSVMFMQGGATLQFSAIAANLLRGSGKRAEYLLTGSWGKKAIAEAKKEGDAVAIYDSKATNYDRLPTAGDYTVSDDAAYLYYCSNETIQGVQFAEEPACPASVPLVSDASSDFLCRPLPVDKYGLLYACAQKNAGPAGVTVVVMRKDLIERADPNIPGYLHYKNHDENDSEWNTPPTFAIYVLGKVARWLRDDIGGLAAMEKINREKSDSLYKIIDDSNGFYRGHAQPQCRSLMNVTFNLPSDELTAKFIAEASKQRLAALKGHRSVGGIRASIYNAMPRAGVETLGQFMTDFAAANG